MKNNARFGRPAFTLIELMAVITIIVILAGLVVAGLSFVNEKQAKEKARVQIALLTKALEDYKMDNGIYPATTDNATDPKDNSKILFKALYWDSDNDGQGVPDDDQKIYLPDLDPVTSKQGWTVVPPGTNTKITDPWGNEYRYRSEGNLAGTGTNTNTINSGFDLWSVGKDGATQGGSSAGNMKDPKNRDDVGHP